MSYFRWNLISGMRTLRVNLQLNVVWSVMSAIDIPLRVSKETCFHQDGSQLCDGLLLSDASRTWSAVEGSSQSMSVTCLSCLCLEPIFASHMIRVICILSPCQSHDKRFCLVLLTHLRDSSRGRKTWVKCVTKCELGLHREWALDRVRLRGLVCSNRPTLASMDNRR